MTEIGLRHIEILLDSLKYSRQRVNNGDDTPNARQVKLAEIGDCEVQLRQLRDEKLRSSKTD